MTDAGPFFLLQVHGDLASLFSPSSVPLSSVGSVLCGCSGCEWVLPQSVTGMLATSGPGYIKPYWCASKMLPKLADDANAAKAVGGDRCYLSSPAPSSQIVPSNKAINLIDQHISFIATFILQLGRTIYCLKKKKNSNQGSLVSADASQDYGVGWMEAEPCFFSVWSALHALSAYLPGFRQTADQVNWSLILSEWDVFFFPCLTIDWHRTYIWLALAERWKHMLLSCLHHACAVMFTPQSMCLFLGWDKWLQVCRFSISQ